MSNTTPGVGSAHRVQALIDGAVAVAEAIPVWFYALAMRGAVGVVFWQSARTKVEGLVTLKQSTFFLFEYEYALPVVPPVWAAYLATYSEHVFSALLLVGLATRLSAAALLVMTLVIQIFVYPGAWALHLGWAAMLIYLIAQGAGALSVDALVRQKSAT